MIMSGVNETVTTKFAHALNTPIHNRCAEISVIIDRYSGKDLQILFPALLESIFGTSGGLSWGIRNITSSAQTQDFDTLHHFLSPLGPVFRLIYKLLNEGQLKYEYPVIYLPEKVRHSLENTKVPPFYADLLNVDPQTRKVYSLCLNAFDFYMFHFAYHIINPWHQRSTNKWGMWDTVYYMLSCDYMIHFLPTDPNIVVLPRLINFTGKNPTIIPSQCITNRPQTTSKLFKTNMLQQSTSEMSTLHQPMQQHPRGEIWRSETVVQIFIDIWLNNDRINSVDTSFNPQLKVNELPSGEYIRILRVFVKQIHAFSASARNDTTPLGELKKIVQPMLQNPMYAFLRHIIYRWPLDGSFRLVLELWLSFIQPWRYTGDTQIKALDTEVDETAQTIRIIDQQYFGFIADNLLAYTVILQQLLPRFTRIDLSSPKNSVMLYRVCKVFGQPHLVAMIREIESCIDNLNNSPSHAINTSWTTTLPPLSPSTSWSTNTTFHATNMNLLHNETNLQFNNTNTAFKNLSGNETFSYPRATFPNSPRISSLSNKWAAIVRHRIYEWEGPEFCYKPMFTRIIAVEVYQLIKQIQLADEVAVEIIQQRLVENARQSQNFFAFFVKSLFGNQNISSDEFSMDDRRRVPLYLHSSKENLMDVFQLDPDQMNHCLKNLDTSMSPNNSLNESIPTATSTSGQINMSPVTAKIRAKNIKYLGDPDLHPIRSSENAFLVRVLYHLAQKINEKYSMQFQHYYNRRGIVGKLSRQILCAPVLTYTYDKTVPGYSPLREKFLPPRLSLRYFTNHRFLAYILIGYLITKYCGYGLFSFVFLVFCCWSIYILLKTLFDSNSPDEVNIVNNTDFDLSF